MIRAARQEDAKEAARLLYDALHDVAYKLTGGNSESEVLYTLEHDFIREEGRLSYRQAVVDEENGEVAGIVVTYAGADAPRLDQPIVERLKKLTGDSTVRLDQEADLDEYYIDTVSVSPNHGRKGIGSRLIAEAERMCKQAGLGKIALAVEESNLSAHSLYVKLGYVTDKQIGINGKTYKHMVKRI